MNIWKNFLLKQKYDTRPNLTHVVCRNIFTNCLETCGLMTSWPNVEWPEIQEYLTNTRSHDKLWNTRSIQPVPELMVRTMLHHGMNNGQVVVVSANVITSQKLRNSPLFMFCSRQKHTQQTSWPHTTLVWLDKLIKQLLLSLSTSSLFNYIFHLYI